MYHQIKPLAPRAVVLTLRSAGRDRKVAARRIVLASDGLGGPELPAPFRDLPE